MLIVRPAKFEKQIDPALNIEIGGWGGEVCTKTPVAFRTGLIAFKRPRCVDDGADDDDGDDKSLEMSSRKIDISWAPNGSQRIDGHGGSNAAHQLGHPRKHRGT